VILSEADARDLSNRILARSKADSCIVTMGGSEDRHIRFAQNRATTSGSPSGFSIAVEAHFGKRAGSASSNDASDASLDALVAQAEDVARRAPENPEFMPPLGPQSYPTGSAFAAASEAATSDQLAAALQPVLQQAAAKNLQASGFLDVGTGFSTFATSKGLFVYDRDSSVLHTVTARTPDGTGSGWAGTTHIDFSKLDAAALGATAIDKAVRSQKPIPLDPGHYTVILEPSGVADLVGMMVSDSFDQREADEGRSFATKPGGGSRVGEKVFGANTTLYSDPNDPLVPGAIYSDDGQAATRTVWVDKGVLKTLPCGRYWAQKSGIAPVPSPTTLTLAGGTGTTVDLIKQVKRGLLITRFWYIREVDPQTVLLTGLTRDGVFLIEGGEIVKPVHNFRFNESPVAMLGRVRAMGASVRAYGEELGDFPVCVPPLLIDGFNLTSTSDAV
jgi:predicted Zn-dependent protease